MFITLTESKIRELTEIANIETERDIYTISYNEKEITINGDWSIEKAINNEDIDTDIVDTIEMYCTKENIDWEYISEYATWCD